VALYRGSEPLAQQVWTRQTSHGEYLVPAVEFLFQLSQLKISDLDAIAVGVGPGSFTGVRIAVNTAKAMAYAAQKPLVGFSTLQIMAQEYVHAAEGTCVIAVMDALNGNQYFASYLVGGTKNGEPRPALVEQVAPLMVNGDELARRVKGARAAGPTILHLPTDRPKGECLAALARFTPELTNGAASTLNWNQVAPLYIRASSAEEKMGKLNERQKNLSDK
jgi:tRNA threonylcarbamoyl adenosine modification protein YeaZ